MVLAEQLLLARSRGEAEEHKRSAKQNREDAGEVGVVGALQEGFLRARGDLGGVVGVALGGVGGAGERLLELGLDAVGDERFVRRGGATAVATAAA